MERFIVEGSLIGYGYTDIFKIQYGEIYSKIWGKRNAFLS